MVTSRTRDTALRAATAGLAVAALVTAARAARRRRREWRDAGRYSSRTMGETLDIPADREPVYWLLRDVTRMARLVDPDAQVALLSDTRSRWTLTGPRGEPVTCLVEVDGDVPELMLSWSVPDGPLPHEGRVELTAAPAGTRIHARVGYDWSNLLPETAGIEPGAPERVLREVVRRLGVAAVQEEPEAPRARQPASRADLGTGTGHGSRAGLDARAEPGSAQPGG